MREGIRRTLRTLFNNLKFDTVSCWELNKSLSGSGYPNIWLYSFSKQKYSGVLAHRFMYEMFFGPIPKGMVIMHSCNNKRCVNPFHLYAGTQSENMYHNAQTRKKKLKCKK